MNKYKTLLTLIFSALGVFGVNEYYKPKNVKDLLKWKGVKLASSDNVWKSMFFEFEEELIRLGVDSPNSLWTWCNEKFKQHNLSDEKELNLTKKYCSDSAKTIMGRIIRAGEESRVINKDDIKAFSINYILTGRNPEVVKLIGTDERNEIKVGKSLSEWCEKEKRLKIFDVTDLNKMENFKKRCYNKNVRTVGDLLVKLKKRVMREEEFDSIFNEKFKYAPKLIEEINNYYYSNNNLRGLLDSLKNKDKKRIYKEIEITTEYGGKILKSWCQSNLKNSLEDDDVYPKAFGFFVSRCTVDLA